MRLTYMTSVVQWIGVALLLACSVALLAQNFNAPKPVVVAYVFPQEQVIQPGQIAAKKLTRINYAFANVRDGRVVEGFPSDAQNYTALVALKKDNPELTVLVSVGGWLWSGNFSDAALTPESRARFAKSAVEFIERYNLDGLDVDWEYPAQAGAGNRFRPEDKQNYTLVLKEIRREFDQEEKKLHRRLYLTIATGASPEFLEHTEMTEVQKYVDTINLMAYDYYEPDSDATTGNHAPLFLDPADPKQVSADKSVQAYEAAGVLASKIVLGVPFYGHVWGHVSSRNHGLFQPGKQVAGAFTKYSDPASMLKNGFKRYWDQAASAPYLYNAQKGIFVSYEDPQSLRLKCAYVREHRLAGIMFWTYGSDRSGALLNTIDASLGIDPGSAVTTSRAEVQ